MKLVFLLVLFMVSPSLSASEFSKQRYDALLDAIPKIYNTHSMAEKEFSEYPEAIKNHLSQYPNDPIAFYMQAYLYLIEGAYIFKELKVKYGMSSDDYLVMDSYRERLIEVERLLQKSLELHDSGQNHHLTKSLVEQIGEMTKDPKLIEKALLAYIQMTSVDDLITCPDGVEVDCYTIANSWPEFLYEKYKKIFDAYSYVLDIEGMDRVKKEFVERVHNEAVGNSVKYSVNIAKSYEIQFSEYGKSFLGRYESGSLESQVFEISDIPTEYSRIPLYWSDYVAQKNLSKYAGWDTKGMESPSGLIKTSDGGFAKTTELKMKKSQQIAEIEPKNSVVNDSTGVSQTPENADSTLKAERKAKSSNHIVAILVAVLLVFALSALVLRFRNKRAKQ